MLLCGRDGGFVKRGDFATEGAEGRVLLDSHAVRAASLPEIHRESFDRILIAQVLSRDLTLVSVEPLFDQYEVRRLW